MVTPRAIDVKQPLAASLVAQPELLHHSQARGVLRADVDLDAVQPGDKERVVDRQGHRSGDDAAARELGMLGPGIRF